MKLLRVLASCLIFTAGITFTACMTLAEKTGHVLDGSAFAEKTLTTYRTNRKGGDSATLIRRKDGAELLAISLETMPGMTLYGTKPDADGRLYITMYTFLCGNYTGWNEFTMDLSGSGTFLTTENEATFKLEPALDIIQISGGKIRRGDERITGELALSALRNRYQRLAVLVEWMHSREKVPAFESQTDFEAYWKPILMPELVSKRKRPVEWQAEGAEWKRSEDINWNTTYTASLFPKDLALLRDSGSILRDWEEALPWLYLEYRWDNIVNSLSSALTFIRIK
jgi:hypothetical protein